MKPADVKTAADVMAYLANRVAPIKNDHQHIAMPVAWVRLLLAKPVDAESGDDAGESQSSESGSAAAETGDAGPDAKPDPKPTKPRKPRTRKPAKS